MNISTPKENADYKWAVYLNRYLLDAVGLWPADYRGRRRLFAVLRAVVSFTLTLFVCTIPCLCSLIVNRDDVTLFMENLGYCITILISQLKFVIIYKKKKILLWIVNMLAEDWAKSKSDAENVIMISWARVGRSITVFIYTLLIILVLLSLILPRFGITVRYVTNETDVQRTFPIPVYYVQNAYRSPHYEMLLILQLIVLLILIGLYTGTDTFLAILILHVCGQLQNLRNRIANTKQSEHFGRALTGIVQDHIRLIRAVDVIENTFTLLLLAMLLYLTMFASIFGLLLLTMLSDKNKKSLSWTLFTVGSITNTFLQTFCYCLAGQILTTQSEGLFDAVYECDWLSVKSKEAKSLILMMVKTKTPVYITAGKLFPMTVPTFCSILKISFSYISLLMTKLEQSSLSVMS